MPRADAELDLNRISELQERLGTEREAIVTTLVTELATACDRIQDGLDSGDLPAVAAAAHAARNSALMIDAQPLLRVLRQVETCARSDDPDGASAATARLGGLWPRLRDKLERAVD
jgi:Hpt domain